MPAAAPPPTLALSAPSFRALRGKRVTMRFVLSAPAAVTLTIRRGKKVVATLRTTRRVAGRAALTWSGRIKGRLAPRGTYRTIVRAVSAAGVRARDSAALRIR